MKKIVLFSLMISLLACPSFVPVRAENFEPKFFSRAPGEVSKDLFEKLFALNSREEDYYLQIGLAYLAKGDEQRAEELFRRAIQTGSRN